MRLSDMSPSSFSAACGARSDWGHIEGAGNVGALDSSPAELFWTRLTMLVCLFQSQAYYKPATNLSLLHSQAITWQMYSWGTRYNTSRVGW